MNQCTQSLEIFNPFQCIDPAPVLMKYKRRSCKIPNFMRDGTHQNSGVLLKEIEAQILAACQFLRKVYNDGGKPIAPGLGTIG